MSDQYPAYPGDQNQPQPPPGYNPPPPAGQQPQYQQPQYAGPPQFSNVPFASWGIRVGAYLVDSIITGLVGSILLVPGMIWLFATLETKQEMVDGRLQEVPSSVDPGSIIALLVGGLLYFVFVLWNQGIRAGSRGQSLGKQVVGIQIVDSRTGQFIGGGKGVLRMFLGSILGSACFVNYLWPLFDAEKRTWHDMVMSTYVVKK